MISLKRTGGNKLERVVGYARYSSDNQREESIQAQTRAIEKYCLDNELNLLKIYKDEGISGTSTNDRIEFNKIIEDSSKKLFSKVIVHKLDRFSRNRYDSAIAKRKLKDNGVTVSSVLENLNGSPESIITESLLEGMAEYYSANLSREVKKGYFENVAQGKHCGAPIPYGYYVGDDQKYQIKEDEAVIIKKIFELRAGYTSYVDIVVYLEKLGIPLDRYRVSNILKNEKYVGIYRHGKALNLKGFPVIVELELFQRAQIPKTAKSSNMSEKRQDYLLSNLMTCEICGDVISGGRVKSNGKDGKKYYYYRCNTRNTYGSKSCNLKPINKDKIEDLAIEIIKTKILSKSCVEELAKMIEESVLNKTQKSKEPQKIEKELLKIKNKKNKILDIYLEGSIEKNIYLKKIEELSKEELIFEERKKSLEVGLEKVSMKKIIKYLENLREKMEKGDSKVMRTILKTFIISVRANNERLVIDYSMGSLVLVPGVEPIKSLKITRLRFNKKISL